MKKTSLFPKSRHKYQYIIILPLFIALFIPGNIGFADTGSNPEMKFDLEYNIEIPSIDNAKLMFCDDVDCKTSQEVLGPFRCDIDYCSYNYGGNGTYKLIITFSDKTRESNVFQKSSYDVRYSVVVNQDSLQVDEKIISSLDEPDNPIIEFLVALAFTIIIELLVAGMFLKRIRRSFKPVIIIIANLITVPLVWFIFPLLPIGVFIVTALAEIFALLFEAWFIQRFYKGLSFSNSLLLSLSMNLVSFLIPFMLSLWGYLPSF